MMKRQELSRLHEDVTLRDILDHWNTCTASVIRILSKISCRRKEDESKPTVARVVVERLDLGDFSVAATASHGIIGASNLRGKEPVPRLYKL